MVDIDLVNIPVVVEQTDTYEDIDNNEVIEDVNNSSMTGCVACSNLFLPITTTESCSRRLTGGDASFPMCMLLY